ncbi:SLAP domain-containing protein [Lactobacillus helveticus]|nr:SLAP domain-containing protein [Lactobacillus helveticus]
MKCLNNGNGVIIKGVVYYQIGKNRFIKAYNTIPQEDRDYTER